MADQNERREFKEGGENNKRHWYRRKSDHVLQRIEELEARLPKLDLLEKAVEENTTLTKKAAADSAAALTLVKKIDKNTSSFVAVIKSGQKAGQVTIKGVGWFRTFVIWASPLAVAIGSFYYTFWGKK